MESKATEEPTGVTKLVNRNTSCSEFVTKIIGDEKQEFLQLKLAICLLARLCLNLRIPAKELAMMELLEAAD